MTSVLPKKIQRQLDKLAALEAGGVDNWEWYDEALKCWQEENEKEELAEEFLDEILSLICSDCKIEEPAGRGAGYGISHTEPLLDLIMRRVEKFKDGE